MTYAEKLKDPKWQKKRLEVMDRDGWTCKTCGDTEATLTVHHISYRMEGGAFADVWDYGDGDLTTLCDKCHSEEEEKLKKIQANAYHFLRARTDCASSLEGILMVVDSLYRGNQSRRLTRMDFIVMFLCYDLFMKASGSNNKPGWHEAFNSDLVDTFGAVFGDGENNDN